MGPKIDNKHIEALSDRMKKILQDELDAGNEINETYQGWKYEDSIMVFLKYSFNSALYVEKVTVPKGTVIYEGTAAPQVINGGAGYLPGGGNQVYIPNVESGWFH